MIKLLSDIVKKLTVVCSCQNVYLGDSYAFNMSTSRRNTIRNGRKVVCPGLVLVRLRPGSVFDDPEEYYKARRDFNQLLDKEIHRKKFNPLNVFVPYNNPQWSTKAETITVSRRRMS